MRWRAAPYLNVSKTRGWPVWFAFYIKPAFLPVGAKRARAQVLPKSFYLFAINVVGIVRVHILQHWDHTKINMSHNCQEVVYIRPKCEEQPVTSIGQMGNRLEIDRRRSDVTIDKNHPLVVCRNLGWSNFYISQRRMVMYINGKCQGTRKRHISSASASELRVAMETGFKVYLISDCAR